MKGELKITCHVTLKHFEEIPLLQSMHVSLLGKTGAVFSGYKECLLELQEYGCNFRNIIARVRFYLGLGSGQSCPTPATTALLHCLYQYS